MDTSPWAADWTENQERPASSGCQRIQGYAEVNTAQNLVFPKIHLNIFTFVQVDERDQTVSLVLRDCGFIRDGYKLFFDHLEEQRVPLLILSAGVGDVLEEVIRQNRVFHPNICIISNYMDFDQAVSYNALVSTGISGS